MRKELAVKVNGYLANVAVSYVKLHNLHWNVVGPQFKAVHEYLESIYDAYAAVLDAVAELLKMQDEMPLSRMSDYLAAASIKEIEAREYSVEESISIVLADMEEMKAQAADIRALAEEDDNFPVANMMEDNLAEYSKNIWFLKSMLK
ncbi:MAG: DNA starvation/stationary phase protection protein [Lachnospiraceae bacterium]|nr:DNA starvation/stationary phase protection protein [Lachnospiraceae bacterium]